MKQSYLLAVFASLLWSSSFAGVKIGLQYADPFIFSGLRFTLAGVMVLLFTGRIKGYGIHMRKNWRVIIPLSFFQTSLFYGLLFHGVNRVSAAVAAIILGSEPLFTALMAHLFMRNEKLSLRKTASIALAMGGLVLISVRRDFSTEAGLRELSGILMLFSAVLLGSLSQIIIKRKTKDPLFLNSQQMILGGLFLLMFSQIFGEGVPESIPLPFVAALLWLCFVSASAFSIWFILLKRPGVKVSEINLFKFIIPAAGAVLSWILVPGEYPDPVTVTGTVIITLSIVMYYARKEQLPPALREIE